MQDNRGVTPTGSGLPPASRAEPVVSGKAGIPNAGVVTIPREVYDFLMGEGPLEGVWFGDLHRGLPGAFWWRGVLRSGAGWPEPAAQAMEARRATTTEIGVVGDDSAVA